MLGFGTARPGHGVTRVVGYSLRRFGAVLPGHQFRRLARLDRCIRRSAAGLAAAYVAGIPFFQYTLLGTLFYSALLFGSFSLLRRRIPALGLQTA